MLPVETFEQAVQYMTSQKTAFEDELKTFLKIPSVSTDSKFRNDVERCADYLVKLCQDMGLKQVEKCKTAGNPIVYGEWLQDPSLPTVLFYGHYDVQPADPLDLWDTPPFEPQIRDGYMYARGASDDKGQVFCLLMAVKSLLSQGNGLPVNVKILIEGEEEVGSPNLVSFLATEKERLASDIVLVSDTPMFGKGVPSICYSLRGLSYLEIFAQTTEGDLHSGQHGGVVQNPIHALSHILAKLKDENGVVNIPGFYDDVQPISPAVKEKIREMPFDESAYMASLGVDQLIGEADFSSLERRWFRPTLDCNGIIGGYIGEGAKTVIPAKASAKVSMRLVANQNSEKISRLFRDFVEKITPPGVRIKVVEHHGAQPALMNIDDIPFKAAEVAIEKVFGRKPLFQGEGGSIPIVAEFKNQLGIQSVLMGFNLPDDCIHAPNERFGMENYHQGILTVANFFQEYGRMSKS
ncbi:MAG: acetylornithine deacetylase/succinyl-diaminopimelate desuccinylase-like protein [Candidatus Marinamargulisbacteria bacterium]|jgi:acetylornithine deacetylase/succinyl-diaminopimelate desuccinylase-like protein